MALRFVSKPSGTDKENVVVVPHVEPHHFKVEDADSNKQFFVSVEPGDMVLGTMLRIDEAFAGGTPTLKVGTIIGATTDDDSLFSETASNLGTVGYMGSSLLTAKAYSGGAYFPAGGRIVVTLSTGLTAGEFVLMVYKTNLKANNWREADL